MKDKFKYIVILIVLLLPFIYSYFYLKAYWNPYGEGNIDNLPVAIVNNDTGNNGSKIVKKIKDSKKLKITELSEKEATTGLNNGKYYAIIKIPKDFTSNIESVKNKDKYHATIVYSPNQKVNYLASQIINSVVNSVEQNLDNEINSKIVKNLTNSIEKVPTKLEKINNGFKTLKDGTKKLSDGSNTLSNGTNTLNTNYKKFNSGILDIKNGASELSNAINTLDSGIKQIESSNSSIDELISGVNSLKHGSDEFSTSLENYTNGVNGVLSSTKPIIEDLKTQACNAYELTGIDEYKNKCISLTELITTYDNLLGKKEPLTNGNRRINNGITSIYSKEQDFRKLQDGLTSLKVGSGKIKTGAEKLTAGADLLYYNSAQIESALGKLNSGATTLNNGLFTLDNSVLRAKNEISGNVNTTKKELNKLNSLSNYSKEPVKVKRKEVNKIDSYGIAFSPLFLSIGLWIGCLMMFMVFYYDKKERFGVLGNNSKETFKQLLMYHGLITLSAIILGILSQILLNLQLPNVILYYISIILIANTFMSITELLITNFNDIGKFICLILLILQLAAAGGTFPIETVTKGFRWLHNILPMTYSINLFREVLVKIDSNLVISNMLVLVILFVTLSTINIVIQLKKQAESR